VVRPLARISHHPFSAIAPALLYLLHPCSRTATALCGIPHDFHSVRALNSVSTMPARSSVAKDTWDTTFRRLGNCSCIALLLHIHVHIATKGGEKCGLVGFLLCLLVLAGCERKDRLVEQHLLEFGTIIKITLITQDLARAETLLAEIEARLKTYRKQWHAWEDSDLTRFNQALAKGENVPVPRSLQPLLQLSQKYYRATNGLFNPALGKLIAAYGFHDSNIDVDSINAIKSDLPGMDDLEINAQVASSRNRHLQIDLGGIAKGYAIGLIGEFLDAHEITDYIVNAGGDLLTSGSRFGKAWRIGIQNPYAPGAIASIDIEGRYSLFTSGNYQRQYRQGGAKAHHIIDPRSGESSRGQSSATVLMRDPVRADVAATSLMVDGVNGHKMLSDALEIDDYLIITESREILVSRSMAEKLEFTTNWPIKIVN